MFTFLHFFHFFSAELRLSKRDCNCFTNFYIPDMYFLRIKTTLLATILTVAAHAKLCMFGFDGQTEDSL